MPRKATALTAAGVKAAKPGRYGDGNGLYLYVRSETARFWLFRYTPRAGKMREMGLGRAGGDGAVTLADARDKAIDLFRMIRAGIDPLAQREAEAAAAAAEAERTAIKKTTFRTVGKLYLEAHADGWRNDKHSAQWGSTLETYAYPHMGDLAVGEVGTEHVLAALEPIWRVKPETAARVRGRIESILDYATSRGWRAGENPARWRGHLSNLLPARSKVAAVEHHAALPWEEIGIFLPALRKQAGIGARALEFTILTAARSGEVLGARWAEMDLEAKIWTVPAARMKAGREHRVPLSAPVMTLLTQLTELRTGSDMTGFIFPGSTRGRPLSNMAMAMVLRRMKRVDLTIHGFRSTFRDWVGEATAAPREVAEAALAHVLGSKTEAAYARGDLLGKRHALMNDWAAYCSIAPKKDVSE